MSNFERGKMKYNKLFEFIRQDYTEGKHWKKKNHKKEQKSKYDSEKRSKGELKRKKKINRRGKELKNEDVEMKKWCSISLIFCFTSLFSHLLCGYRLKKIDLFEIKILTSF